MNSDLTIKKVLHMIENGEASAEEIRQGFLREIELHDKKLNAYLEVYKGDEKAEKSGGALAGIPCAVKDSILVEGKHCTAGSKILSNYTAAYDATAVSKLKAAGAVILGKTNLDEFAMGTTGENSAFGPTLNPYDDKRIAGGSSCGSVAAVAADMAVFALGSDTGGSIRMPASLCGVVGLKPTYGRVSRHGLIAMASGFDQIGPITKTVEDAAIVLNVISGRDPMDSTSSPAEVPDFVKELDKPVKGLRAAVPKEYFGEGISPDIKISVEKAISVLGKLGIYVDYVNIPTAEYALAAYYILVPSEVSSNLARYDGIKYGKVSSDGDSYIDSYLHTRAEFLGPEVRRRVIIGTYTLSAGYYDAYYLKAQKVRTLLRKDFEKVYKNFDVIVGPVAPMVAPKIGELTDPLSAYMADMFTVQANLVGIPAISVPCGTVLIDGKELPVGFQIMGRHFDEATILRVAHAYELSR
ncbi:MAG: aspartyl-tRNA(Asn)/glutamyl-tRNA (Gln) amidotransferase subunit A [Parcubacteria group bacterium Licking1014_17]|nr:MAG: aspartyl-tRNA(Asn)/glutamyl-tRNA (Gln) amidotransferase subunit A [Parcubacteria group bacterium Licking1014_17]